MAKTRQKKDRIDYYAIAVEYIQRRNTRFAELFPGHCSPDVPAGPLEVPGHALGFGVRDFHRYQVYPDSSIQQITSR